MKSRLAVAIGCLVLLVADGALAHRTDLIVTGIRSGPIKLGETTVAQMESWFGPATSRKVKPVGCVRQLSVRWGRRLHVFANPRGTHEVSEVKVKRPTIVSAEHGDLSFHTRKGLAVDDPERRVRRLYPKARSETHAGHTHYILRCCPNGGRLLARVESRRVVGLENWPYEYC